MEAQTRIGLSSVLVDDQERALAFYTEKLGFLKKNDIPMGEYRWLTVVAPDGDDNVELVLEPIAFLPPRCIKKPCSRPVSLPLLSSPMPYMPSSRD